MIRSNDERTWSAPMLEALEPRILLNAVRTPWLAGVTETTVYVCLEATNYTQNAVVDFGLTSSYGSQAFTENTQDTSGSYYVHNIKLTDLAPNTLYHYKVTHGTSVSADYTFYTAPSAGTSAHWGFTADCRSDPGWHNIMAGLIDAQDPRMMVYGGDLCASASYSSWGTDWFVSNQVALNATTPWTNGAGNHEGWNDLTAALTQGPSGDGDGYYSFDYGDSHIVIINNEIADGPGSVQWNWVKNDLESSTATYKIVAFHRPAYAWGSHGGDADMQLMTTEIFEPLGVNLVLGGHDHFYQHNEVNRITHMVIGTFAVSPDPPGTSDYTIYGEETRCFGIIDTTPTSLTLTTYRQNGTVIEIIVIDGTDPTIPTSLSATPLSDDHIQLSWTASADPQSGVDHYRIYRDGTLVGTTDQTTYTDTGLDELTAYTYRVSAVNGDNQESVKSGPAGATTPVDTTAPTIISASWVRNDQVNVLFSEPVEQATAGNAGNYVIYSTSQYVKVFSATLQADNRTVKLDVSTMSGATTYTLAVSNVKDQAVTPHTIAANSQTTFAFTGWLSQDVGACTPAGSSTYASGQYTILADGKDIFSNADGFHYVYTTLDGDGEIICRVVSVADIWCSKGGVMMR
ncbi:MAG TPA: metallophosphoesterase, partial [Phycisphaerae bacterium]|nr:metallophosphoesterase [Phycisphaerae bacterium]